MTSASNSKIDGVVGVIRTNNPEYAYRLAKAWNETSITQIEVTMTVPNALEIIEKLLGEGVTRLGGGTVRTVEQIRELKRMGASFAVAPHSDEKVIKEAVSLGLPITPGALTPSEIFRAKELGASSVKIFPINSVGGLTYIEAILEPLPDLKLVVSGGVQPREVQDYLRLGCVGVCMGGALWSEKTVASGDLSAIRSEAEVALQGM
jgi:2-dehydro-3-deoxyphosphogluconate aldolase/(4S)-4-hydroxy-2-oxoglutarate aldolase